MCTRSSKAQAYPQYIITRDNLMLKKNYALKNITFLRYYILMTGNCVHLIQPRATLFKNQERKVIMYYYFRVTEMIQSDFATIIGFTK